MLNFMIKPTSFKCNIACKYCFYLEKQKFIVPENESPFMDIALAKEFVEKKIREENSNDVYFLWQGGEPLLAGLDFYVNILAHQEKIARLFNKKIHNAIQTNGTLIDDNWAKFFKKNKFLVGISIDGNKQFHNNYRKTITGKDTFTEVSKGLEFLRKNKVEFNTLTVINNLNSNHPLEIYNFLKSIGSKFMQFIPVIETMDIDENYKPEWIDNHQSIPRPATFSVTPLAYANFMNSIFDEWIRKDITNVSIRMFDSLLARFSGYEQTLCHFKERCGGNNIALESDSMLYQCDHFVYPESRFKIGNFKELSFKEIEEKTKLLSDMKKDISSKCKKCQWLELCHGGCPKHRFINYCENERISYFCEGYQRIFEHITPGLNLIMEFKEKQIPWNILPKAADNLYKTLTK